MKNYTIAVIIAVGLLSPSYAFAQKATQGSEKPAVYGTEKSKILAKEERMRRSEAVENVAQTYREMVAAYKAKRIERGEEMSRKLTQFLQDPILPAAFAEKMQKKQDKFLDRIYGEKAKPRIDVPVDEVSSQEVGQIQEALREKEKDAPPVVEEEPAARPTAADIKVEKLKKRKELAARRLEAKKRRREEKQARLEERRKKRIAAKKRKLAEAEPEQRSASVDEELNKIREAQRKMVMDQRMAELQAKEAPVADDAENEINRYVQLYKKDAEQQQARLQEELASKTEALYQDAIEFYDRKAYHFALNVFTELEKISPNYKKTRTYLAELKEYFRRQRISARPLPQDPQRQRIIADQLDAYRSQ